MCVCVCFHRYFEAKFMFAIAQNRTHIGMRGLDRDNKRFVEHCTMLLAPFRDRFMRGTILLLHLLGVGSVVRLCLYVCAYLR